MSKNIILGTRLALILGKARNTYSIQSCREISTLYTKKQHKKVSVHPNKPVVTRFAPSPTGSLHIGSLRTALYNYLLARNTGGKFILRLEDTDRTRLVPGAEENIYDTLKWCGFTVDEGPIKQSERTEIYAKYIQDLLDKGFAYRCFCSKDRLDAMRLDGYDRHCVHMTESQIQQQEKESNGKFIIRFKAPDVYDSFDDLLHGSVNIQERKDRIGYDDPVLIKSDGMPTYHFANVVDDHLMGITHVIRGEEWLPSTPKHIALYNAFGWTPPEFVHIPLLTSVETDKKLSKRRNDASVLGLQEKGILPEALLNFCVLLGWSPPRDLAQLNHECFSLDDLIKLFNLDHLTKGNVKVDNSKLLFFNKHFLQKRIDDTEQLKDLVSEVLPKIVKKYSLTENDDLTQKIQSILTDCGHCLSSLNEFEDSFSFFFEKPDYTKLSQETQSFFSKNEKEVLLRILSRLNGQIEVDNVQELINIVSKELDVKKKVVFQLLRFAQSGSISGAKIHVMVDILGSEESNARIKEADKFINNM